MHKRHIGEARNRTARNKMENFVAIILCLPWPKMSEAHFLCALKIAGLVRKLCGLGVKKLGGSYLKETRSSADSYRHAGSKRENFEIAL
jgi:hypothetical protein